jgi:hypothetical protein
MWTEITRPLYERSSLRYAGNLTNEEWKAIAPHLLARRRLGQHHELPFSANRCRKMDVCGNPV